MSLLSRLRSAAIDTRPLAYPDFRRLWSSNAVSFIGFQLTAVAVPVQVFEISGSSLWVGVLGGAALVPLIIFGLLGGAISDAVDRRVVLLVSSVVLWLATWGLLAQALLGMRSIWLIFVLVAVQSAAFAVTSPTRSAIIPRLLPVEMVASANTLNFTFSNIGTIAGPLIAGVLISHGSYAIVYAADAVLYTFALYAAIRLPAMPPTGPKSPPGLRSVLEGLAFIATRPVLLASFGVDIVAMVLAMPRALFPEIGAARFGGEQAVGWLFAAIAIGSVTGGLVSGWIGRIQRQGVALIGAVVAWGVAVALAGLAGQLWLAVLFLAVAGAADLVSGVYRQTILQIYAPDEMRGRMQGVFTVVVAGGPRLGDVRAGVTAAGIGATASWVWGGVACVVVVLLVALLVPAIRTYRADTAAPAEPIPDRT